MDTNHPPRKRLRRWEGGGDVRFITFSCYQRRPAFSQPRASATFCNAVQTARRAEKTPFELFAWIVMPEHVHMLVRIPPDATWSPIATSIKTSVARRCLRAWTKAHNPMTNDLRTPEGRPRFWQHGGGFDRSVRDEAEFSRHVQYIHRNPVERGLVDRPEAWRWSSVRWWMGQREGEIECDPPPGSAVDWSSWTGFM